jgi:hypothetical protein
VRQLISGPRRPISFRVAFGVTFENDNDLSLGK